MVERVNLFGLPLDIYVTEAEVAVRIASGKLLMTYLNPLAYHIPRQFPNYPTHLDRFNLIICDGVGVQRAVKSVFHKMTPVISPDYSGIGRAIFKSGAEANYSMCLVGGKPGMTELAAERIAGEFPGYKRIAVFAGYGNSVDDAKRYILQHAPDMLIIGMGMGRQEAYLLELVEAGWKGVGICVGGVLDKVAQPERFFYPKWSEKTNLRFLGRLVKEPRRMSRRYFLEYRPFIKMYIKHFLKGYQ